MSCCNSCLHCISVFQPRSKVRATTRPAQGPARFAHPRTPPHAGIWRVDCFLDRQNMIPTPQKFCSPVIPVARASWGRLPGISEVVIVKPANMSYSHRPFSDPQHLLFPAVNITVCDMSIIVEVVLLSGSRAIVEGSAEECSAGPSVILCFCSHSW